jgi:hypothetical protein
MPIAENRVFEILVVIVGNIEITVILILHRIKKDQ